jgi:hypothetical protein
MDEQMIGFQGRHVDKLRISYKNEGDGFQCDALCDEGYTYSFYFRNDPAPKKYTKMGLSPLHARVMALFDTMKDKNHRVAMDNLYMSAKFARAAYNHPNQVLIAGVTRKGMCGLPKAVIQEEVSTPSAQVHVRGTVKAAVLKGDPNCPSLIATSVYDTKPVHFLSMSAEGIEWVVKERMVFNIDTQQMEGIKFLHLNVNDDYNNGMGNVDASDQLQNYYRFDHWLRNRKWWWSILFWAEGVMLVNAYILYIKYNMMMGKKKKDLLSQYDFRKQIALAWIAPGTYDPRVANTIDKRKANKHKRSSPLPANSVISSKSSQSRKSPRINMEDEAMMAHGTNTARKVSDSSLAIDGSLSMRLSTHLKHRPAPERTPKSKCQLHRWASGTQYHSGILWCQDCRVHLCVRCFGTFHDEEDLIKDKAELGSLFQEQKRVKQTKAEVSKWVASATQHAEA